MYFTIYKIVNKINGKEYIGKHITKNINDGYMGSGKYIKRAIKKYGLENFTKEILFVFENEEEMNRKEKEIVTEEYCNQNTYNLCVGGHGGFGYINKNNLGNTDDLRVKKSNKMKEYWTEDKKKNKSETMKKFFKNEKNHVFFDMEIRKQNIKKQIENGKHPSQNSFLQRQKSLKSWQNEEFRKKQYESRINIFWWTNGIETLKSKECPGEGWIRGRSNKNLGRKKYETN
jgi:hypothetical protein